MEGYLTNFFAHFTMILKEMDGDSTLCFFLETHDRVPCAHLLCRQRVEESPPKLPPMTGRFFKTFEMILLLSLAVSANSTPLNLESFLAHSYSTRWIQLLGPWVQFLDEHHDFLGRHPCVLGDGHGLLRPVDLARVEFCGEKRKRNN